LHAAPYAFALEMKSTGSHQDSRLESPKNSQEDSQEDSQRGQDSQHVTRVRVNEFEKDQGARVKASVKRSNIQEEEKRPDKRYRKYRMEKGYSTEAKCYNLYKGYADHDNNVVSMGSSSDEPTANHISRNERKPKELHTNERDYLNPMAKWVENEEIREFISTYNIEKIQKTKEGKERITKEKLYKKLQDTNEQINEQIGNEQIRDHRAKTQRETVKIVKPQVNYDVLEQIDSCADSNREVIASHNRESEFDQFSRKIRRNAPTHLEHLHGMGRHEVHDDLTDRNASQLMGRNASHLMGRNASHLLNGNASRFREAAYVDEYGLNLSNGPTLTREELMRVEQAFQDLDLAKNDGPMKVEQGCKHLNMENSMSDDRLSPMKMMKPKEECVRFRVEKLAQSNASTDPPSKSDPKQITLLAFEDDANDDGENHTDDEGSPNLNEHGMQSKNFRKNQACRTPTCRTLTAVNLPLFLLQEHASWTPEHLFGLDCTIARILELEASSKLDRYLNFGSSCKNLVGISVSQKFQGADGVLGGKTDTFVPAQENVHNLKGAQTDVQKDAQKEGSNLPFVLQEVLNEGSFGPLPRFVTAGALRNVRKFLMIFAEHADHDDAKLVPEPVHEPVAEESNGHSWTSLVAANCHKLYKNVCQLKNPIFLNSENHHHHDKLVNDETSTQPKANAQPKPTTPPTVFILLERPGLDAGEVDRRLPSHFKTRTWMADAKKNEYPLRGTFDLLDSLNSEGARKFVDFINGVAGESKIKLVEELGEASSSDNSISGDVVYKNWKTDRHTDRNLAGLIFAGHFLGMQTLVDLAMVKIAGYIRGKTSKQMEENEFGDVLADYSEHKALVTKILENDGMKKQANCMQKPTELNANGNSAKKSSGKTSSGKKENSEIVAALRALSEKPKGPSKRPASVTSSNSILKPVREWCGKPTFKSILDVIRAARDERSHRNTNSGEQTGCIKENVGNKNTGTTENGRTKNAGANVNGDNENAGTKENGAHKNAGTQQNIDLVSNQLTGERLNRTLFTRLFFTRGIGTDLVRNEFLKWLEIPDLIELFKVSKTMNGKTVAERLLYVAPRTGLQSSNQSDRSSLIGTRTPNIRTGSPIYLHTVFRSILLQPHIRTKLSSRFGYRGPPAMAGYYPEDVARENLKNEIDSIVEQLR
jgi:hypothetical protein